MTSSVILRGRGDIPDSRGKKKKKEGKKREKRRRKGKIDEKKTVVMETVYR